MGFYGFGTTSLDAVGLTCVDSKGYTRNIGCAGGGNLKVKPVCGKVSPGHTSTVVKSTKKCIGNLNTVKIGLNGSYVSAIEPFCGGISLGVLGAASGVMTSTSLTCPSSHVVTGVQGKAGFHINSFEIVCGVKNFEVEVLVEAVEEVEYSAE